ncbi:MAG: hypothetical protein H0U85_00555 [Gemmatimonadales bacterium]|nr:hypothetical protein [Gemmatimonadales bacterium]
MRIQAMLELRRGDYAAAREHAETAHRTACRLGVALLRGECAAVLSVVLERLGRLDEAAARKAEAAEIFRTLGAERLLLDLARGYA